MKNAILQIVPSVLALASTLTWAGPPQSTPDVVEAGSLATEKEWALPLTSTTNLFADFGTRLQAAIERKDLDSLVALYQTNGVAADVLAADIANLKRAFADNAPGKVLVFGKELSALPSPEARAFWRDYAQRLTTREVTHMAFVHKGGVRLVIPLVVLDGRLLIVPSDASKDRTEHQ